MEGARLACTMRMQDSAPFVAFQQKRREEKAAPPRRTREALRGSPRRLPPPLKPPLSASPVKVGGKEALLFPAPIEQKGGEGSWGEPYRKSKGAPQRGGAGLALAYARPFCILPLCAKRWALGQSRAAARLYLRRAGTNPSDEPPLCASSHGVCAHRSVEKVRTLFLFFYDRLKSST